MRDFTDARREQRAAAAGVHRRRRPMREQASADVGRGEVEPRRRLRPSGVAPRRPAGLPEQVLLDAGFRPEDLDGSWQPFGPIGCDRCKGSGYKGRVGIYQVMPISEPMTEIIMNNGNSLDLGAQAQKDGVKDLRQSGLLKVKQGVTSLAEVLATTND